MKRNILIVLLCLLPYFLNAQNSDPYKNIIPPNPDAASLAKYADFPVDLSTGVVQVSIPLWNIKCGDINVPISLSYHASGIPVAETPSYVGLGWTLNAGGAITRTIRGTADDGMEKHDYYTIAETDGILKSGYDYTIKPNSPEDPGKYKMAAVGKADLEPDMFYYNFCSYSGCFAYDFKKIVHLIPRKNIKIEKEQNTGGGDRRIIKWKITTDDGLKYYFEKSEKTKQLVKTRIDLVNSTGALPPSLCTNEYNSAWFLTRIETSSSLQSVSFEYDDITQENTYPVSETYKDVSYFTTTSVDCQNDAEKEAAVDNARNNFGVDSYETTYSAATITGKRLRKIIAPDQTIEFIPGVYRYDLQGDRVLDQMIIRNKKNEIIKQFKLSYKYFSSNGLNIEGTTANANTIANTNLRLSLNSVQELDKNNNKQPPYIFEYENSVWLTDRLTSKAQDHWGYYNGENGNTSLIPYRGAKRDANENAMKAGSLVKIYYPTGGYTQFAFEANKASYLNNPQMIVGGLRIKEKVDYDPITKKSIYKQYNYNLPDGQSSGYISYKPIYDYETSAGGMQGCAYWDGIYINSTSSSNTSLKNGEGGSVCYEKVTVIEGNDAVGINGKTENIYTKLQSIYSSPVTFSKYPTSIILGGGWCQYPFASAISGTWGSGLLKSQYHYKYNSNNKSFSKIKEIQNIYKNDYWGSVNSYNSQSDILAAKVSVSSAHSLEEYGVNKVAAQFYYIPSRNINLINTIETDYDDNEKPTTSKIVDVEYENSSPYIYPYKTTTLLSDDSKQVEQTLYPLDYTNNGSDFIGLMKTNNIINKPIEKITYKSNGNNTLITNGNIFTYKIGTNIGKPDKVYNLQTISPISKSDFKLSNKTTSNALSYDEGTKTSFSLTGIDPRYTNQPEITCDSYDSDGNLLQYHKTNDNATTIIYNYNNALPIVKATNVDYAILSAAVSAALSTAGITDYSAITKPSLDTDQKTKLLNFITALKNNTTLAQSLLTVYTYNPLIGMTSQTDPNGQTTYYEYDDFGRLSRIRDQSNNIIKNFNYHYQNQIPSSSTGEEYLTTSIRGIEVGASGSSSSFSIKSNTTWDFEISPMESSNIWIKAGSGARTGDGVIYYGISANTSKNSRTGIITVYHKDIAQKITLSTTIVVNQSGVSQ